VEVSRLTLAIAECHCPPIPRLSGRSDLRYTQQVFTQGKAAIRKQEKLKTGKSALMSTIYIKCAFHIITQTAKAISLPFSFSFAETW
jgi:hypothetical protein